MLRSALVLALTVAASHALGQSFQSALPLDEADRRVMEARLSTILDFAAPGEVRRFELPSGRTAAVRPYMPVNRPGDEPCRGYRVDLFGSAGSVAVDGFRCRRADLNAWVIVEPEIVLAQDGAPLDLTGPASSDDAAEPRAAPDETAATPSGPPAEAEPQGLFAEGEVPPVPRPAPREAAAARTAPPPPAPADEADEAAARPVAEDVAAAPLEPIARTPDEPAAERTARLDPIREATDDAPADRGPAPAPETATPKDAGPADDFAAAAGPADAPQPAPAARAATERDVAGTRIVGESEAPRDPGYAADPRIVAALRDLAYLDDGSDSPSDASVRAAVDAFARDERFALPISSAALMERLSDALVRSSSLPPCDRAPPGSLCVDGEG